MTQYAFIHLSVSSKSQYIDYYLSRHYRSTMVRLKFGHGKYPAHLHRINLIESPACACDLSLAVF